MVNQSLLDYIKNTKESGYADSLIKDSLIKNGWSENDIAEAFSVTELNSPVIKSANVPEASVLNQKNKDYFSPFSVGLAIVLVLALFVLVNKIFNDIKIFYSDNINSKLIFDAILTIPFLIISFVLYSSLSPRGLKFNIVYQPFLIVTAFLFLRLLWDVGVYILDVNATYGVYLVLIMSLVVLTSFIFIYKKFIKN